MNSKNWRSFDFVMMLTAVALVVYGLALIYSGSMSTYGNSADVIGHPVAKQVGFAIAGLLVMVGVARLDYRNWSGWSTPLYALSLLALLFVLTVGQSAFGSRRWILVAGTPIEPSELAKLVTIVLLARYLADNEHRMNSPRVLLSSLGIAIVPALLVFVEPDLGTAVIFMAIWLGMVFMAGARLRHLVAVFLSAIAGIPFLMLLALNGYQRDRLAVFLDPSRDPFGTGFNILQAQISIGSGGLWGKGLTHGTQTQLDYLRTQTTDYIFSVLGEELGFAGALLLFMLFILLLMRGLRAANLAPDNFGRLIATGSVIMILFQVFINVGVNLRIFPVTGIPLPFISQGGSSLITLFAAIGILQSILLRRRASGQSRQSLRLDTR
ncbi:MAG TPA: rod shape-determining protein RodA [Dehalococcoidia bacterium]|nr:rod shape-determining protein RodA [Dehalococcoidia bacterium]